MKLAKGAAMARAEVQRQRRASEKAEELEAIEPELAEPGRERIGNDHPPVDTATPKRLTREQADAYNAHHMDLFRKSHPEAHLAESNIKALGEYFERTGMKLVPAQTLVEAYKRLDAYGYLEPKSTPSQPLSRTPSPVTEQPKDTLTGYDFEPARNASSRPAKWTA